MTKLLLKSFLSLCILLASGGQLYSHVPASPDVSLKRHSESSELAIFDVYANRLAFNERPDSSEEIHFVRVVVEVREEEDQNELTSFKERSKAPDFLHLVFCSNALNYFSCCVKELLSSSDHFSYFSSPRRLLILQVFRI
ncbi:MAG: hypothetical protein WEB30_17310 [Cyclobacteriaceae bacterium]